MTAPRSLLALAACLAPVLALSGCAATAEGKRAPAVTGEHWLLLEGKDAPAVIEGRWGLVVFFHPHRPACNEGFGELRELYETFRPRGLVAVAVTPDTVEEAKGFIQRHAVPFPVLADGGAVMTAWGLPDMWENRIYLVDPRGIVVAQDDLAATRRILEKYLPK